jgi:hypothetical protein
MKRRLKRQMRKINQAKQHKISRRKTMARKHNISRAKPVANPRVSKAESPIMKRAAKKAEEGTQVRAPTSHVQFGTRHHLKLPVGSMNGGRIKIRHAEDGKEGWVSARAGQVLSNDGHPISSRNPNGK